MPETATTTETAVADSNLIPGQYIVVYKSPWEGLVENAQAQQALAFVNARISELGVADSVVKHRYEYALRGFTAKLSDTQLKTLQKDPRVKYIEQDRKFKAFVSARYFDVATAALFSGQTTPWGVSRVGGAHNGIGQTAWILDTGIDLDHPDLNVDVGNSASFVAQESADDLNGHGSHVAGILAAEDNNRDVVGVAAGASVVSVKVLDQFGGGTESNVVAGINHVSNLASAGDIINMSLGGPISQAVDDMVTSAANAGLRFTIAAGNGKQNANNVSPARVEHPNVWTLSAFKQGDNFAVSFDCNTNFGSNFGGPTNPPIEYSAPGNNITSLSIGGGTEVRCGTSMAAPHLAGLLLVRPNDIGTDGFVSGDPDNDPDPIAVAAILEVTISGDTILQSGQQGYWQSQVKFEEGSISYQWFYRDTRFDPWISGSTSSSFSHTFDNMSSTANNAGIKVEITSAGETAEDVFDVLVQPDCASGGQIGC